MMLVIGYGLAICIGLSLGLLGGGGSVLALPVLVYVMGVAPKSAIAMTLVIVGSVSLFSVVPHIKRGNVNFRVAAIFGSATMVGAYLGAKLATSPFISSELQMWLFAIMMLIAAIAMLIRSHKAPPETPEEVEGAQYVRPLCKYCWLWLLTEGIGVGILTGLVGVGGGFAIVPALVLLGKIPMRQAIASSLLIIAFNSVAGLLGYLGSVEFDWHLTVSFTFLAGCGSIAGVYLSQYVTAKQLQKWFSYFLLGVTAFVMFQNFGDARNVSGKTTEQPPQRPAPSARL